MDEKSIQELLNICQQEKLPLIVAISGGLSRTPANNEVVVGFALARAYQYGLGGLRTGRSRTTAEVQLYVHKDFTHKGVGRCLLDRITQCLSFAYGAKDGYPWMNPGDNPIYKPGGKIYLHQILIQLPILSKDDPNIEWISAFLRKYWYIDEGRIERVGRTSPDSDISKFLDIVLFFSQAMPEAEFTGMD